MKIYFFLVFYILSHSVVVGQMEGYAFMDITPEQLEMTRYEADTSASAVVLHDYGIISVTGPLFNVQVYSHNRRIKILKKGGLEQGNIEIPYYSFEDNERFLNLMVAVSSPDGEV